MICVSHSSYASFVANVGGLLGLCMGFSFVSVVELICFIFKSKRWKMLVPSLKRGSSKKQKNEQQQQQQQQQQQHPRMETILEVEDAAPKFEVLRVGGENEVC
jgi:hypothetical protein